MQTAGREAMCRVVKVLEKETAESVLPASVMCGALSELLAGRATGYCLIRNVLLSGRFCKSVHNLVAHILTWRLPKQRGCPHLDLIQQGSESNNRTPHSQLMGLKKP